MKELYSFSKLKVCFVGLGSIASKHIENLRSVCKEENVELTVHALRRATNQNMSETVERALKLVDRVYTDISQIEDKYDAVFITNPTDLHMETLTQFHDFSDNFFIEKPVISVRKIKEAVEFKPLGTKNYYVACPLRYTDVLRKVKEQTEKLNINGVRCISSSYLPEWRPGTDYRECYSAHKDMGGGVSIDLIHEWDYITWLFGFPKKVSSIITKKSSLEIHSDDLAVYIAEYQDKVIELHLDYFGRKTLREIMIFAEEDTIAGDFIANRVSELKSGNTYQGNADGKTVGQREIRHFLDIVDGKIESDNDIEHSIRTLKLAMGEDV